MEMWSVPTSSNLDITTPHPPKNKHEFLTIQYDNDFGVFFYIDAVYKTHTQ